MNLSHLKMHLTKINWFGVAGGTLIFIVILSSLYHPWWQLTIGEDLVKANVSPMNTHFGLLGAEFTIPLIYALNIGSIITFLCSGIIMLIYSADPTKSYANELLNFAWKKPLYSVITSITCLSIIILIAKSILGMNLPLIGKSIVTLPTQFIPKGSSITVTASAAFQWPLYLAITAAILCIIAKFYHKKITNCKLLQQNH